jgi:hypothetical protein
MVGGRGGGIAGVATAGFAPTIAAANALFVVAGLLPAVTTAAAKAFTGVAGVNTGVSIWELVPDFCSIGGAIETASVAIATPACTDDTLDDDELDDDIEDAVEEEDDMDEVDADVVVGTTFDVIGATPATPMGVDVANDDDDAGNAYDDAIAADECDAIVRL